MARDLEALRSDWTELALESQNVFATWEWASTWVRHFAPERELSASIVRSGSGSPIAVLPLYVWARRPLRVVRFIGHGPADELGPVCAPRDRRATARALLGRLAHDEIDVLLAEQVSAAGEWQEELGGTVLRREASPTLRLAGRSWEDALASWSPNRRQEIRRRERRLARAHAVRFRLADDAARLDADLDVLFALHKARWGGSSTFRAEAFHREFAAQALARGWLRFWILEVDERAVAAWYGYRFAGIESYYQAGRDPGWAAWSVGSVLLVHSIREATSDGMEEYRFLRGDEAFKYRLADADRGVETVAVARSAAARAAVAAVRALRPVPGVRPMLRRLTG